MNIHIFVTNIHRDKDVQHLKFCLDARKDIQQWSIDLSDEEKVLRIVTTHPNRNDFIVLIKSCGFDCHAMEW